jgi:hypothetical protein
LPLDLLVLFLLLFLVLRTHSLNSPTFISPFTSSCRQIGLQRYYFNTHI